MPTKPVPGLYEALITQALDALLNTHYAPHHIRRDPLTDDAHVLLADHIKTRVHNALQALSGKPAEQAALINQLLTTLNLAIPGAADDRKIPYNDHLNASQIVTPIARATAER